ncbi:MAG: tRNA (adenosine(37)-N6)-dimethylallyltransferase MiaA [Verrucomicrobiota bacterium]
MKHIGIIGPTASGKSGRALQYARPKATARVISMDAFQVYRGMDIGTGKISSAVRDEIPHEMIDILDPMDSFSVADYIAHAKNLISELPEDTFCIWVGGAGLYFKALRDGLAPIPATDPAVLEDLEKMPHEEMVEEIKLVDPTWADAADLNNPRRVQRAFAVYCQTGRTMSSWQEEPSKPVVRFDEMIYLNPGAEELREKIDQRVEEMWESGWVQEVEALLAIDGWTESQSFQAIGYSEVALAINQVVTKEEAIDQIKSQTWQYARRQRTMFNKLMEEEIES